MLNVSFNYLQGRVPNPLNVAPYADVDLSSNLFEGEKVPFLFQMKPMTGEIPASIGEMLLLLQVIDLSRNNISGNIPSSIWNYSFLKVLDLAYNNLSGEILASLGQLRQLQSLHLNDNKLTGNIPLSFQNLSTLATLDLGNNRFSGHIPL
ncbi:hypothetical protein EZV62_002283 [Acer yangbiense]|uniref:Leucine-rich repeat-containing N-terminal plant-type domain-containing protein n=1 Tax=Acer yangbiense TaxID=1000413 RepID=A0A5C7IXT9_9ROSI|nr:hypothetical protein EZV62_002283 [Acer yangbiense]